MKDIWKLKHLRPITLVCTDYKVLEKDLANRLKSILPHIINHDQQGFMADHRIATNIRKAFDIMTKIEQEQESRLLVSIDFQKCFDMISFEGIFGALEFFGIGPNYIQMVKTTYTDFKAVIQNNGHFSERINIDRGARQGGPNSSFLFLVCAEVLAIMLRSNLNIEGIPVQEIVHLLAQYADDMSTFIPAKEACIKALFATLTEFNKISRFVVNYEKTTVYRMGSIHDSNAKYYIEKELFWTNDPVNMLGIWIHVQTETVMSLNYGPILDKVRGILKTWQPRNLSLLGRIKIVNLLVASVFVYKMTVLPRIKKEYTQQVEGIISDFIWNNKKAEISMAILQTTETAGGANLVNLMAKDTALKVSWINIINNNPQVANLAYYFIGKELCEKIWMCRIDVNDVKYLNIKNTFWVHVMEAWATYRQKEETDEIMKNMILWWNSRIRVDGRPFFWKRCYCKGLIYISQLVQEGQFISAFTA